MGTDKKITVHVPAELLEGARQQTGKGITATVRLGLRMIAAGATYTQLRQLRGQVAIGIDLGELREDRR